MQILKSELKRLGLEDNSSRTELQKVCDKDKMPHPNTYVNRFGSWRKALELIEDINGGSSVRLDKDDIVSWTSFEEEESVDTVMFTKYRK